MVKILLDSEPNNWEKCPFMGDMDRCIISKAYCSCIGGYYDSRTFNFEKCRFCKVKKDE